MEKDWHHTKWSKGGECLWMWQVILCKNWPTDQVSPPLMAGALGNNTLYGENVGIKAGGFCNEEDSNSCRNSTSDYYWCIGCQTQTCQVFLKMWRQYIS